MVSPTPSTSANPPLSYAERAKKAQNIKPRGPSQHVLPSNVSIASNSTIAPSVEHPPPSTASKPPAPPSGPSSVSSVLEKPTTTTSVPSFISAHADSTEPPSPLSAAVPNEPNGHPKHSVSPATSTSSAALAPKTAPTPPVNVWTVRKEQMAQARALNQPRAPQPSALSPKPAQPVNQQTQASAAVSQRDVRSEVPDATTSRRTIPSSLPSQNPGLTQRVVSVPATSSAVATNGSSSHANLNDDPFTVRPRAQAMAAAMPPSVEDVESWPEVGKAPTASATPASADAKEKEEGTQSESSEGRTSRKST